MAKTSKRGVRLTDGGYGKRPKHYVPGETSSNKPNKKKKSKNSKKNIKAKAKKRPPKKTKSQKAVVFDLFVKNENKPLSNIEIAEKTKFITHNIRRITGEETHKGSLVRVDRGIYKLSDALYSNLKKHNNPYTRINNEELPKYIFEEDEISQYTKDLIESITKEDIQKAIFKAKPKYFKDKNKINVSVTEYLNFEFLIQNNYYIEKVRKDKNDVLMYSFSGSLKHYYLRKRTSDKKYLIPLFPLFIYLFKEKTNKELRKEYSLESFEYFLRHLNNELPNQELISSTEVGKSILFKIRRGYMDIFNKSIKDAIEIEKELRIEIWNDLKESTTRKKLTTRDEWNEYISNKYNVNLHRTERGIYRESRRTKKITKDDIGLAFSIHSIPNGPYNDKVDEYGLLYDFPKSKAQKNADIRDIESMKRLYENKVPLFVIEGAAKEKKLKLGWIKSINTISKEWIISFSDVLIEEAKPQDEEDTTSLFDRKRKKTQTKGTARPNAREFRDSVIKRYGLECSFCDITTKEILEAAHIIPYSKNGVDHPENGLILCRNHHRLLDNGLILINPESMELESSEELDSIGVIKKNIKSLPKLPGKPFLEWLYKQMT